jgi:hypothetical protein
MTESTRRFDGDGFERHKIYLYKEDFNRFLEGLEEAVDIIKKELMPDYDFEEFDRRQLEYEARMLEERDGKPAEDYKSDSAEYKDDRSEEDMDWK